jgi:hypothetical protein
MGICIGVSKIDILFYTKFVKMLIKMGPYVSKGFLQVQISNKY